MTNVSREQLEQAIAAQEQLRGVLDDVVVDAAIAALRSQLALLEEDSPVDRRRRQATVMFVDVVDSTDILRDRDPEETMAIMDSALQRLAGPVRAAGGRVTRFMGDGYLAVFGLPVSHENDAEMAVRAGLDVIAEAGTLSAALAESHGLPDLAVRVGINTGLVVTGGSTEAADTIMGSAVNLAARLESAAPRNGLLISQGTYQHVRDRCTAEAHGSIEAKGFPEPVPVYLVTGWEDARRRGARPVVEGIEASFTGREDELAVLRHALDEAIAGSARRTVSLRGEAGIGKSRTVREFEDRTGGLIEVHRARAAAEDRSIPYALLRDLLVRRLDIRGDDGIDVVADKLRSACPSSLRDDEVTSLGRLVGYEMPGPRPDPKYVRNAGLEALAGIVAPGERAGVIVLEDLQWVDEASLDAVDWLMTRLADTATLFVLVARPVFWSHGRDPDPGHPVVDLAPLDAATTRVLAERLLSDVEGPVDAVAELLVTRSEGNPYFLEELIRILVDDGVLVRHGGRWSVEEADLANVRVPPTLAGVIQARLDALDRDQRALLQRASVIGRVFWAGAASDLGGDADLLGDLVDRDMIVAHASSTFVETTEYAFRQSVLREVTYESVLLSDRARLHGLAADWLEARAGGRSGELAATIASHLEMAERTGEAVGHLRRAAATAWNAYAIEAAIGFNERAKDLADDDATRCDLALSVAKWARSRGDRAKEESLLVEAEDLARSVGDPVLVSRTLLERAWSHYWSSDFEEMEKTTEACVASLGGVDAPGAIAQAHTARAWALMVIRRLDEAAREAQKAEEAARTAGDRDAERSALNASGLIATAAGQLSTAREKMEVYLASAAADGDLPGESNALNGVGIIANMLGDFDAADEAFERNLAQARDTGDQGSLVTSLVNLAWVGATRGRWDEALDAAEEGIAVAREIGFMDAVAEGTMWQAHALSGAGDVDAAHAAYARALEVRRDLGQDELASGALAGLARTALARGDLDEAREHTLTILAQIEANPELPGTWETLRIHLTCVKVLEACGDRRAGDALAGAHRLLLDRASRITDPADRATFLGEIPWHREIAERVAG